MQASPNVDVDGGSAHTRRRPATCGRAPPAARAPAGARARVPDRHRRLDSRIPRSIAGALVLTTTGGAQALQGRLPAASEAVASTRASSSTSARRSTLLRDRGSELICRRAGRHVARLDARGERLVDELFLTVSPLVAGRVEGQTRLGFVAGHELLPDVRVAGNLAGVRRSGEHLFLHYDRASRPFRYLISVSSLNIGRYIERMIVATMQPTRMIMIGSMMDVSAEMVASTSSS